MKFTIFKLTTIITIVILALPTSSLKAYGINQESPLCVESLNKTNSTDSEMKICYFRTEYLYKKLKQMKDIKDELKALEAKLNDRAVAKSKQIQKWQEKWESKGQLLSSEQEIYNQEAIRIQQDYDQFIIKLETELNEKDIELMMKITKQIERAAEDYAVANGFDFVLSYEAGGLYFGSAKYDITNELVKIMNDRYKG